MITDRKNDRFEIKTKVRISKINDEDDMTLSNTIITLEDISKSGIGFNTNAKLKKDFLYNIDLTLFNGDRVNTVIKIVRVQPLEDNNCKYGAIFMGLSDSDKVKIDLYMVLST